MARKAQDVTDAELAILEQLWASGPTSVKVLATELYGDSGASTTATVQKLLERLERKNCVARDRSVWPRLFRTAIDRAELIEQRWFLFWWHPLVWVARWQIESHEERCCDQAATLDRPNQRRVYAETILRTLDFLCEPLERDRSELRARPMASGLSGLLV